MNKQSSTNLQDIQAELNDIRSMMNISGSAFSLIYAADNLRMLMTMAGIFSLVFPFLYQVFLWIYTSHALIPSAVMVVFYAGIIACWAVLLLLKTIASIKAAKQMGIQSSVWEMIKQLLTTRIWLAIVPVLLFLILVPVKFSSAFDTLSYGPYFGIVLGLVLNMIGVMIREAEYSACGVWMIVSGTAMLLPGMIPLHIAAAVMLAPACFLFVIVNSIRRQHRESRYEAV